MVVGHDAIADLEAGDTIADLCDGPCHLVAEDAGGGVGAGVDLLEVGSTDTAGIDADEKFAGKDFGYGYGFDADVVDATVDDCAHEGRGGTTLPPGVLHAKFSGCNRCHG